MIILGIDPASACGWAVWRSGDVIASGVWHLADTGKRNGSRPHPGQRYNVLETHLQDLSDCYRFGGVAYEQAHHRGGAATQYAHGYIAIIQAWAARWQIPVVSVHSATLKKAATGTGRADKGFMLRAAADRWPEYTCADDNEADARFLAMVAAEQFAGGKCD